MEETERINFARIRKSRGSGTNAVLQLVESCRCWKAVGHLPGAIAVVQRDGLA